MASPSTATTVLRSDLAAYFEEFPLMMNSQDFISTRVLPVFNAARASGQYPIVPIEQLLQNREVDRKARAGYSRGDWQFEMGTYSTKERGAEELIDDNEAAIYGELLDIELVSAQRAMSAVMVAAEKRAAALLFNAASGSWNGAALTTTVGTEWSTIATAVPVTDVEAAVRKVYDGCGLWPNALIVNRKVFRNLRNCAQIVDRMKYQGFVDVRAGEINEAQLASVFGLDQIIVAGGTHNTAKEGQSATPAQIWDQEYAMVARVATSNDLREPCVGRTFHYTGDGSAVEGMIEQYRDESVRGDVIRVRHQTEEKVLYLQAAHLLSNITA